MLMGSVAWITKLLYDAHAQQDLPYCYQTRAAQRLSFCPDPYLAESENMAAEDGQSTVGPQSPSPIFTQEQQQWIEQWISSKTQRQGDTSNGDWIEEA